ncbi:hypothetical protein ACZ81_17920 [Alteromonas macleodii]|jgi:hypothetical protein|uniref:DUF3325 domain-containing protein n=1 Tax=Alteromonas macleodii TaxID=28108 RepID=UPI000777B750|nr:DUF3325 domain-containing protein [Alteromonas macleodii]AMN13294.1 hypothetical protein ACZ81_17920 [Alteromonas macleodii]HAM18369.1 DUF3325 domain-containing protein [Alteromonas macleodii]|tara:strand:- start:1687 stop:2037 length:351 start_codon:yes stop_codon:yes gene_type:complete
MSIILDVMFAFVLTYLSFLLLSLGNKKHAGITRLTSTPSPLLLIVLHSLAYLLMAISLMNCIDVWKTEIGVVVWIGLLQLASVMVSATFTYLPTLYTVVCNYLLLVAFWAPRLREK